VWWGPHQLREPSKECGVLVKNKEAYVEKLSRLARLHYMNNDSDFRQLTVEEFEQWQDERDLSDQSLTLNRARRSELQKVCNSLLKAYEEDLISLSGKKGLLQTLGRLCGEKDSALFGRTILRALDHESQKSAGPSSNREWLRNELRNYLELLKNEKPGEPYFYFPSHIVVEGRTIPYPGKTYDERISFVCERYRNLGLSEFVSNVLQR
jgi:hypothetical protein